MRIVIVFTLESATFLLTAPLHCTFQLFFFENIMSSVTRRSILCSDSMTKYERLRETAEGLLRDCPAQRLMFVLFNLFGCLSLVGAGPGGV